MFEGYIRVAAATPTINVADCTHNAEVILSLIRRAEREHVKLLCLPELCITGSTCGDLFFQDALLDAAKDALLFLIKKSADCNVLVIAGLPLAKNGKWHSAAAVFQSGQILGFVPKSSAVYNGAGKIRFFGEEVPFGTDILFRGNESITVAVEIGEDLRMPSPPSTRHALAGASIIANLSANSEVVGRAAYRRALTTGQSARFICGYVYADAGYGESTTDEVFSGHNIICENGVILNESLPFGEGITSSEIDIDAIVHDRRKSENFIINDEGYTVIPFELDSGCASLTRFIDPFPFVPADEVKRQARCEEILNIQAAGLAKRFKHTNSKKAVIAISGGLDSCLAMLVIIKAFEMMDKSVSDILAVTMPCFGTTERTRRNAHSLCKALGVDCREIDISESVSRHLKDIGHQGREDVVFENAQARKRTMVLMDLANKCDGIVVGTGSLSELALGFATYNGDHMSMYAVNASVPKTLVRQIIKVAASTWEVPGLGDVLADIMDTPISPELLPPKEGEISQRTEDILGPYELHDFFLYNLIRWGRRPKAIFALACAAFAKNYSEHEILKWQRVFYRRFFAQQFKRNCLPEGPGIGSVNLSPRNGWKMPSDAVSDIWMEELGRL